MTFLNNSPIEIVGGMMKKRNACLSSVMWVNN